MRFSEIARKICESPTLRLNQLAARLRAEGEPVVHLGGGEPEALAPPQALRAAQELLATGAVRYTPAAGIPELRKEIAGHHARLYGVSVDPANVIACGGAKQAIMVCMYAVLDAGDEVIFPAPYWVSYPEMVKLCGATPVPVRPADPGFHVRLEEITARVTPRTKMVLINSPSNPTGVLFDEQFIREIVAYCEERDIWIVMDDIYHELVFDGRTAPNPYAGARADMEDSRLVVVNGVSKSYAMTGFRLGWAVGARALIELMARIQGQQTSGPSAVSQHAAIGALRAGPECVKALRSTLERNRDVMMAALGKIPGVRCVRPDGTFYCFPDFGEYERDSLKLSVRLLEKVRVVTVPGKDFGVDGHLRLSTCGSVENIVEGVERIRWLLDESGPRERQLGGRVIVRE